MCYGKRNEHGRDQEFAHSDPISFCERVSEERECLSQTTGEYITKLKQDGKADGAHREMRSVRFSQQ